MNEELIQNLVSAAESLSRSVDRAEEKLKTQKENNAKLQQLVFFLDAVAKRKERQVRETEVRVAKRKLRTSTMEMEMETKKREEKVREIELRAWLERDDRKFEQLKEKKRKALEKTTTDSSVTSALNALFEQREEEDQEDQEEERENSKRRKEKEERGNRPDVVAKGERESAARSWPSLESNSSRERVEVRERRVFCCVSLSFSL